jgi:hypothetical protein
MREAESDRLFLTPDQFLELRRCWQRRGLPTDLFYPASERRIVVEPVPLYGGTVLGRRVYSPLEWARRDEATAVAAQVPTEEQRRERFLAELRRFQSGLVLRRAELTEPGKTPDVQLLREIEAATMYVMLLLGRTLGRDEKELQSTKEAVDRLHRRASEVRET